jgi:Predicted metal-sulfur cluster biosynthetic enzyme
LKPFFGVKDYKERNNNLMLYNCSMDKEKVLDQIWENLSYVIDPEVGVSILDLNLVQKLELSDDGTVNIEVRMTTPACPAMLAYQLANDVVEALKKVSEVKKINFKLLDHYMADQINEAIKESLEEKPA